MATAGKGRGWEKSRWMGRLVNSATQDAVNTLKLGRSKIGKADSWVAVRGSASVP